LRWKRTPWILRKAFVAFWSDRRRQRPLGFIQIIQGKGLEDCLMTNLPLVVFDVNETLLDLETMAPTFERIFDDKAAMRLWFAVAAHRQPLRARLAGLEIA
jgi:hypothetical protein